MSYPFHAGSRLSTVYSNYLHSVCARIQSNVKQLKIKYRYFLIMWKRCIPRRVFWVWYICPLLHWEAKLYLIAKILLELMFHHTCVVFSRNFTILFVCFLQFYLQDTKSSNGTFINSQRLSRGSEESPPCEIMSGDIIQFGVDVTENTRKGKGMDHFFFLKYIYLEHLITIWSLRVNCISVVRK